MASRNRYGSTDETSSLTDPQALLSNPSSGSRIGFPEGQTRINPGRAAGNPGKNGGNPGKMAASRKLGRKVPGGGAEYQPLLSDSAEDEDAELGLLDSTQGSQQSGSTHGNLSTNSINDDEAAIGSHSDDPIIRDGDDPDDPPGDDGGAESKLSNGDTIVHLLKGNIGTGILAMPDAIKNSGLAVGTAGLVFMSIICVHCMHMLVKCARTLSLRSGVPGRRMKYFEVAVEACKETGDGIVGRNSHIAGIFINVFLCITQLGFCCVYFVFVAQNMKMIFDHHIDEYSYEFYIALVLPLVLILASIRDIKYLTPFSMLANFLQMVGLAFIFFYLVQDMPKSWQRKYYATWAQLPLYFGTAIYAFEGIGVVLPLENKMQSPRDLGGWNGVLNTAMVIVSCLYIAVGFFGYLKYGEHVLGSITLNLPVEEWLAQGVIIMMSAAIYLSYGLQFYVPVEIVMPWVRSRVSYPLLAEYFVRFVLVLITYCFAAVIPKLDLFISLVGSISSSTLALMAPPVIDLMVNWQEATRWRIAKNVFIFTLGFLGFVVGGATSLSQIIKAFILPDDMKPIIPLNLTASAGFLA